MTYTKFAGIDSGQDGSFVLLNARAGIEEMLVMPSRADLRAIAKSLKNTLVTIEQPRPNPSWGTTNCWNYGKHIGHLEEIFPEAVWVFPQAWQGRVWLKEITSGKLDPKAKSLAMAKAIWPNVDWRKSSRSKVPHTGLVDGALVAYDGLQTFIKGNKP